MLKLKLERLKRRWKQQDLAYRCGMHSADVSRIESGRLRPSPSQLQRLARALKVTSGTLLEDVEMREEPFAGS
jgi:transcriptional regulator with XRE-family HTH domain